MTPVGPPYIRVIERQAANTNGGTFTTGADRTRTLNLIDSDVAGLASLSSNQLTLPAGTYEFCISAPAVGVAANQAWLYNVTDGVIQKEGTSEYGAAAADGPTRSWITGRMTLSGPKTFEVRHRCTSTRASVGLGNPANFTTFEVYTVAEFHKIG